ncbi:HNH endonuclease [Actibacterium sp. MT2.3-13A]|uniref:HNH endonuclease n=1 Tax=Actibacterium sp. MT2.3-13A TaxID=2828332 RepID=UPI001BA4A867|nr:HNH endonuclease [Actibacterium sp. MT2.3-13A]
MDGDELRPVAKNITEWARRVRELRDEEGYQILTHNDRADLKAGQYLLLDPVPRPKNARKISKETRAIVLERDGYTCQTCGAEAGQPHPYDSGRKTRLHLGHILDKSKGGTDDPDNLKAQCSICNEGLANITPIRPDEADLLARIRRARSSDQQKVLKWLIDKFPAAAKEHISNL